MWPTKKKTRQRRIEVRRTTAAPVLPRWQRFREAGGIVSLLIALGFFLGALGLDLYPPEPLDYRRGQYIADDIYPRVEFQVPQMDKYQAQLTRAEQSTPATYRLTDAADRIVADLKALPASVGAATQPANLEATLRDRYGLETAEAIQAWRKYAAAEDHKRLVEALELFRDRLTAQAVLRQEAVQTEQKRQVESIRRTDGSQTELVHLRKVIPMTDHDELAQAVVWPVRALPAELRPAATKHALSVLKDRPLYERDEQATQRDIQTARAQVRPPVEVYTPGSDQPMVRRSFRQLPDGGWERRGLTEAEMELLRAEHEAWLAQQAQQRPWRRPLLIGGRSLVLALVTVLLCVYIARYEPEVVKHHGRAVALVAMLLLMLGLNRAMVHFPETPWSAVLPVVVGATIVAIAHNQRFALTVGAVLALLVVLQLRGGQAMLLVLLAGGMTAVLQLHEIRTRSKLLVVAAVVAVAVSVMVAATALMGGVPLYPFALVDAAWAAGFALMAGLLVQAALPGIERVFRVATSMTLLEWCDASKPLLKRLAMEAPGTYNHSLQLGTMCEAAAEAIGARGLLARVGAYYHDIGKINKPPYFIENQGASPSKHSKLSPAMSLLIIIGHVKDGLEMAREYGLPPVLHEFIASHHGTTLVQYFYHAATEQRKNHADRAPDEVEFRYPGPKPHSKEVAILMLADAAESSVRAMSDPTPGRIENQVHAMVSRRLMDGQLDMCDLTLKEVHVIEASLVKSLCGIYHGRIAYPTPAGQKPSAAETPGRAPAEAEARNETPEPEGQAQTDEQPGEDKGGPARDEASSPQDPGQEPGERPS